MQRRSLLLTALAVPLCGITAPQPARADDAVLASRLPPSADEAVATAPLPEARIAIAQPIGRVMVGYDNSSTSEPRYALRPDDGQTGPVRFSHTRPRVQVLAAPGGVPSGSPLAAARLTSRFGGRVNPVTGTFASHNGIDLAAPAGSPIVATGDGLVSFAGPAGNYGLLVAVDHGNGLQTRYAHMQRLVVRNGQQVKNGDILGFVGSTGRTTGPHLHYEVRANGRPLDPLRR